MSAPSIIFKAGTAFGSGAHPSSHGALSALSSLQGQRRFSRILDMGCGSGVLALTAAMFWPEARVIAADIAPASIETTRENAALNGLEERILTLQSDGYAHPRVREGGPYDLVLCNIIAETAIRFAGDLGQALEPGGVAVLSGILVWLQPQVVEAHAYIGLKVNEIVQVEQWRTLVFQKELTVTKA
jgi:ribosomal protein L11 methyltransferase